MEPVWAESMLEMESGGIGEGCLCAEFHQLKRSEAQGSLQPRTAVRT